VNPLVLLLLGVIAAAGTAIATGVLGRGSAPEEKYAAKLAGIEDHAMSLVEMELSKSFQERVLLPIRQRLLALVMSRLPTSRQQQIRVLIQSAGHPYNLTVSGVITAKAVGAVVAAVVGVVLVFVLLGLGFPINLAVVGAPVLGWMLPDIWLKQKAGKRRREIEVAIPDAIDLLTICLDAGLSFDASLMRIAEKVEGPLHDELVVMLSDIRYGRPRAEALTAMAERLEVEDMTAFVNAVVQSQKLGVALGDTVRIQASEIRRRRRQAAEEKAAQASLKMLFPMIGCIFPTLFIVLMGPVAILLIVKP
jgi:tight adherence protein C